MKRNFGGEMRGVTRRAFLAGMALLGGGLFSRRAQALKIANSADSGSAGLPQIWFDTPARNWNEGLPIGNGRLAAMVLAAPQGQRMLLNEETFWSGGVRDFHPQDGSLYTNLLYDLIREQNGSRSDQVVRERFLSKTSASFETLGVLVIEHHAALSSQSFTRSLHLQEGVHRSQSTGTTGEISTETFASHPDGIIGIRLCADTANLDFTVRLESPQQSRRGDTSGVLVLAVEAPEAVAPQEVENANGAVVWGASKHVQPLQGAIALRVLEQEGGSAFIAQDGLHVKGASAVTLVLAMRTNHGQKDAGQSASAQAVRDVMLHAASHSGQRLLDRHIADHGNLFGRVELKLGPFEHAGEAVPTSAQLIALGESAPPPALVELYFQYGRYLLIASSRHDSLPATRSGKWTHLVRPSRDSGWNLGRDLPANYWLSEVGGLPECHEPVFRLAAMLESSGMSTARRVYGVAGWVAHTQADLWGSALPEIDTTPQAMWKCGAALLCLQAWEAFAFSRDIDFLRTHYPRMRQASVFFVEQMRPDREGWLAAFPEASLSGAYVMPGGDEAYTSFSPATNTAIVRELLQRTAEAASVLSVDKDLHAKLVAVASQLRPIQIHEQTGELKEWSDPAWIASDVGNGQLPQVWPLMPGTQISAASDTNLRTAAHLTIQNRAPWMAAPGSMVAGTCAAAMARLADGEAAYSILVRHLSAGVHPNMLACVAEQNAAFEMAGNTSFAAAIAEMLLQSDDHEIRLLPALPAAWKTGSFKGLRARGGWELALQWKSGRVQSASMKAGSEGDVVIRPPKGQRITHIDGAEKTQFLDEGRASFVGQIGKTYRLRFA